MSTFARAARRLAPAGGLIAGYALDRLLGGPARWHPVAGFGRAAGRLEQRLYADNHRRGVAFTGLAVGVPVAAGVLLERTCRRYPLLTGVLTAATTWTVLGGRYLVREAEAVADHLGTEDLPAARRQVARLVGRTPRPWTPPRSPGPGSSRWPRTTRMPSSRRCCGAPWRDYRGCSAIAP